MQEINQLGPFLMLGSIQPKVANFKHLAAECLERMPKHVDDFESTLKRHLPVY
jgi:hypothetical protein